MRANTHTCEQKHIPAHRAVVFVALGTKRNGRGASKGLVIRVHLHTGGHLGWACRETHAEAAACAGQHEWTSDVSLCRAHYSHCGDEAQYER